MLLGLTGLAAFGGGFAWVALSGKLRIASTSTPHASIPAVVKDVLYTYHGHTNAVISLAWSPDGKRIVSGSSDWTVQVWDAATGGNRLTYHVHTGPVNSVCWSPHGEFVASSSDDWTVRTWNASPV